LSDLNQTVGEALLAVHKSYLRVVSYLLERFEIKGIAHITGGGILGNLSRIVPDGRTIAIDWQSWEPPAIFRLIQEWGQVPVEDMRRTFNLGAGMILVVPPKDSTAVLRESASLGETAWEVGEIQ
jgi:phosphoribosylformylglycinamidine cyclo-ligase